MILPSLVVDASVAIKWIVPEEGSETSLAATANKHLIAPQLIYAECANIIWKKHRRGELTVAEAEQAGRFVDTFHVQTVSMHELVPLAIDISLRLNHAAYDCFYIALAVVEDCELLTADASLQRKMQDTLSPRDAARCMLLQTL